MPWLPRTLLALLIALLAGVPVALGTAAWLALSPAPSVPPAPAVSYRDIDRAMALLQAHDPRGRLPGITRAAVLSQRDATLLAQHAARRLGDVRTQVRLQPGLARLQASLPLAPLLAGHPLARALPLDGQWLDLDLVLRQGGRLPAVERLRLGRLPVPGWLTEVALPRLLGALDLGRQGELALSVVQRVVFGPQQLVLVYAWPEDLPQRLADSVLPPSEQARLQVYVDRLGALAPGLGRAPVSLTQLLPPLFTLAQQRSPDRETAARENRAALLALALLVSGQKLSTLLPAASAPLAPARALAVRLLGRPDTPQHFLVSAVLAADGGGPLSDAIGLYKEVADSRGGSGFSFHDLAADRAGGRLGLLAVNRPQWLQARLAAPLAESALLPPIDDLPEGLGARDFQRHFGGIDGPGYRRLLADIDARLDRLPLLDGRP